MFRPRNTIVAVVEIKQAEKKLESNIVVPASTNREYKLAEIVAVGPGMATNPGEKSLTADLKPGQQVLVKLHQKHRIDQNMVGLEPIGVEFRTDDGRDIVLVEQSQIVVIVSDQPTPRLTEQPTLRLTVN